MKIFLKINRRTVFTLVVCMFVSVKLFAQQPTITSFAPTTVCQGGSVTIIGTNLNGVKTVRLGTDTALKYTVNSATSITAFVSTKAQTGTIIVVTNNGSDTTKDKLTINPLPNPVLEDVKNPANAFTNCNGEATYELVVANKSTQTGGGCKFEIDWGDNSPHFTQTDWPLNSQTSHTYNSQGYFPIKLTTTTAAGCVKSEIYRFYNGANPLASITTTTPTTGLCAPATIVFKIGNWFNNSTGTVYELNFGDGSPPVVLQHPLNNTNEDKEVSHTYTNSSCPNNTYFTASLNAINGCFPTTYTVNQIVIRKKPIADFNAETTCVGTPVCFENLTTDGSSGSTTCNTVSNYTWNFGDGQTSNEATPECHNYATAGTYTITLTSSNATCGGDTKSKTIIVKEVSAKPIVSATPVTYCQNEPATQLTATGTGLLWYISATGGTGTSTAPTPLTKTPGTTTYYVTQTLPNQCESPRVPISVTVHPIPNAPGVTTPLQLCQGQIASPLTASGTGLRWYTTATGGTGTTTAPTPSTAATGTTNYYVSQTVNGCESPRATITVNVESLPAAPGVITPVTYCQNQAASPLTATGTGLRWYTTATGGTGSSAAPVPPTGTVGSTDFYVSQTTGCGEGPRALITVTVKSGPSANITYSPNNLCNVNNTNTTPNPPVNVTLTGSTGGAFSISPSTGLLIIPSNGTIDPSGSVPGSYIIFYKIQGTGGCSDFTASTTVNVNSTPKANISYPPVCTANGSVNVQLTGSQGGIYSSTAGLSINATTGAIDATTSTPGNYVVTYTIAPSAPCPGFTTTTNVTVTKAPSATISYGVTNLCNVSNSASTPNPPIPVVLTGTKGGAYSISPSGLPIKTVDGTIDPSGAQPGSYTISYTIPGSGGCADFVTTTVVNVSGTPQATISYLPICTSNNPVSVQFSGSKGGTFSSTAGLVIDANTGVIMAAASKPGNYVVTYTIAPSAPCPGFTTTTNVTVTEAPAASIAYTPANLCNVLHTETTPNPKVDVSITGTADGTFSINPSTGLSINTISGQIDPSGATAGVYTISYTIPASGGCSQVVATTQVTINSTPTATINYAAPAFCRSINVPQQVNRSGSPGGVYSSASGLSINASTGEINPSLSTPGTYTVKYTITPSAPCPGFETTTTVVIDDSPVISFSTSSQSICSGGTAVFKPSSTVANTVYKWSVTGTLPAGVSGVTSGTATEPNAAISLSFTNTSTVSQPLTIHVVPTNPTQNPCDGASIDLTLIVNPIPAAVVVDTFKFCMHTPPQALSITGDAGNTINWHNENSQPLNTAPVINTDNPATFTYYASQSNVFGCESPQSKVLAVVNATAKIVSSTFSNPTHCGIPSGSITLHVLDLNNNPMPNTNFIVHYTKFQTAYTIAATSDASGQIIILLVAGTYSDIYVESNSCLSQKIPDVFILKDPTPPAQPIAGYNGPVCTENILSLSASSPTSSQVWPIDYVWVGPAFGSTPDTTRNTVYSFPSAQTSYAGTYIVYAIQNNCISPATSFTVVIKQSPSKPVITTRSPLCVGDDLSLQAASSIPGNSTLSYTWNGPGSGFPVNNAYASINDVTIQDGGIYTVTVNSAQTGCSATTDTLIKIGNYPVVKFPVDSLTVPTGYLLNLTTTITNANEPNVLPMKSYAWMPSQDIKCNSTLCDAPVATIKNNGCYYLTATNEYGCIGRDTICVKVFCQSSQVLMANAFTPNGNGANRVFMVRTTGISSVKSFRIFNRWGRLVFERSNFAPNSAAYGWDGFINGKPADVGVYVYTVDVVCENGVPYTYKGNVTLLK